MAKFRHSIIIGLITLLFINISTFALDNSLGGRWVGGYTVDGEWTFVRAQFRANNAIFDYAGDINYGESVDDVELNGNTLTVTHDHDGQQQVFSGQLTGSVISGAITIDGVTGEFHFERVVELPIETYRPNIGNYEIARWAFILVAVDGRCREVPVL